MKNNKIINLIILIIVSLLLFFSLKRFEFLIVESLLLLSCIYIYLKNNKKNTLVKTFLRMYYVAVASLSSVFLILFSYIIYNGYKHRQINSSEDVNHVLVLGSRLDNNQITDVLELRLKKALEYYKVNKDVEFIVSGGPADNGYISEAFAMKQYLIEHGVPENSIHLEDQAQSTFENIKFAKDILCNNKNYTNRILIVTSDFHISRALMLSESFGLSAIGLSSDTPNDSKTNYILRETLAFIKDLIKVNIYKLT